MFTSAWITDIVINFSKLSDGTQLVWNSDNIYIQNIYVVLILKQNKSLNKGKQPQVIRETSLEKKYGKKKEKFQCNYIINKLLLYFSNEKFQCKYIVDKT
jgi:hypothetical protein